jgi:hypothetical protein
MAKALDRLNTLVPPHLRDDLLRYIDHGVPTGGFLSAVLSNNLIGAFSHADKASASGLEGLVTYIYNYAPIACCGSPDRYKSWLQKHRNN